MIIAVNCFATFAIFCGLKLIDIGSTLSEPVRKFSPALGIIFAIVAIANFLLGDTLSLLDSNYVAWTVTVSMVAFAFLCFLISIIKRSLLVPKRKQSQKRGRASKLSVAAVGAIDVVTGCVIGAVSGISFTLNFGKTFSKYLFIIEADDDSKDDIVDTGYSNQKAYAFIGSYPKETINNITEDTNVLCMRITPASSALTRSGVNITFDGSSITINASAVSAGNASYLYRGMTYNYFVVEIP